MPQTTVEKKSFRVRVGKTQHKIASRTYQKPTLALFQGFPKNIARGEE
ncbi:MAG: hypothetical protein QNJ72_39065 [Pleurocapsa sp. MO_226.B13]|nr:hypothetical protein [Pleurocapsa sp. MO_226.B13]